MTAWTELAAFVDRAEAIIVKGMLEANGIAVLAPDLFTLEADPGLSFALGGYRLLVRGDQIEAGRALLAEVAGVDGGRSD